MDLLDGWMRDEFAGCVCEWREISLVGLLPLVLCFLVLGSCGVGGDRGGWVSLAGFIGLFI